MNTAQLVRIGTMVNWKQYLKKGLWSSNENNKEENRKDEDEDVESSEGRPEERQGEVLERTLLSASYQNSGLVFCLVEYY